MTHAQFCALSPLSEGNGVRLAHLIRPGSGSALGVSGDGREDMNSPAQEFCKSRCWLEERGANRTWGRTLLTYQVHSRQDTRHPGLWSLCWGHFPCVLEIPQEKRAGACGPDQRAQPRVHSQKSPEGNSNLLPRLLQMFADPQTQCFTSSFIFKSSLYQTPH